MNRLVIDVFELVFGFIGAFLKQLRREIRLLFFIAFSFLYKQIKFQNKAPFFLFFVIIAILGVFRVPSIEERTEFLIKKKFVFLKILIFRKTS